MFGNIGRGVAEAKIRSENPEALAVPEGLPHKVARDLIDTRVDQIRADEIEQSRAPRPSARDMQTLDALRIGAENGMVSPEEFSRYESDYNAKYGAPAEAAPTRASGVVTMPIGGPARSVAPSGPRLQGFGDLNRQARNIAAGTQESLREAGELRQTATDRERQSIRDQQDLAEMKGVEMATGLERRNAELAEVQARNTEKQRAMEAAVQEARTETDELRRQVRDGRVDPEAWARDDDGSTWEAKSIAALSMALGAIGQAFTGGENQGMKIINAQIDRNIDAQKANLREQRLSLQDAESAEGRLIEDKDRALQDGLRAEVQVIEGWKRQAERLNVEYLGPEQQAMLEQTMAGLDARQADATERLAQLQAATGLQAINAQQGLRQAQNQVAIAKAQASGAGDSLARVGLVGRPVSKKARDEAVNMAGNARKMFAAMDVLDAHIAATGQNLPFTNDDTKGKSLATELQLAIKDVAKLGVLAGLDMDLIDNLVPSDPGSWRQGRVKQMMESLRGMIGRETNAYLYARGLAMPGIGKPPGARK